MKAVLMVLALSSGWAAASEFAVPHTLIDVGGGRKMNLYCSGTGAATVVFDAPAGDAGWAWHRVQPEVAKHTRACVFDRAGFGFSDPSTQPNTADTVASDLHRLLTAAGEKGPYIMVGNSLGGANVQVYAYRYPQSVKGLVLVEAQHEDETARLDKVSGGKIRQFYAMFADQNKYCLEAAQQGFAKDSEKQTQCIGDPLENYGPQLGAAMLASELKPSYWRARSAEYDAMSVSDEQLRKLRRPFGDIPVMVLTRGISPYAVPGQPQSASNKAFEDENVAIQKEFTRLSPRSTQRIVAGAGHAIQADKPEAVVSAVLEVLKQVTPDAVNVRIARIENDMRLAERMPAAKVPGVSIAVINDGKIEWARGYGYADVAGGRPVTEHTRFQTASISKPVAAMAALSLVQAGKLSLDQDVNQYLKAWKVPENQFTTQRKVTLRALLSHTAGISGHGYFGYPQNQPLPTLLELLDGKPPANSAAVRVEALPGSAWKYSGGGYEIVQLLVTETSGEPFDGFVQRTVLDKIGMRETSFAPADKTLLAHAYLADGSEAAGGWHRYPELAAAALWSTPSDLARFAIEIQNSRAGKSSKVLSQQMTKAMLTPGIEAFGLGLFLGEASDVRPSFYHGGGNHGFRNMMFAYDATGQGAVVMSNGDNGDPLVREVLGAIAREYGWSNYRID